MQNILFVSFGVLLGAVVSWFWWGQQDVSQGAGSPDAEPAPLYWVAPMDANYRRDKPGKSPMGMDLVPVYANDGGAGDEAGLVKISPLVVNNLGVRTAIAETRVLTEAINTVGYVQYDEEQLIHIHPRVGGWVEKLHAKAEGNPIKRGQPLYELYSPELVNAQEDLLLALKRSGPELALASESRLRALHLTQDQIDAIKRDGKARQRVTFYAPQDGVLATLMVREGFFVQPGTTMMSIGVVDEVWVEAEVFERQLALVKKGLRVEMTLDAFPGRTWHGQVDYVYPALNEMTRTLRVRLRFANPDLELKPNMFVRVTVHTESGLPVLVVPTEALIRTGEGERVVLALGDGRFKAVPVRSGRKNRRLTEIRQGLAEGDSVVTSAQFLLDSESSKAGGLSRISEQEDEVQSASVHGTVNRVDDQNRLVNITRGPIPKWNRGPATLDFLVAEELAMSSWQPGEEVHFTFEIRDGVFLITDLQEMVE